MDELRHYGVIGMKWGVRRYQNKDGSLTPAGKKHYAQSSAEHHPDYTKAHDRKSVKTMSDAELRARLNRLNMEKQYSQLSKSDVDRGRKYLKNVAKAGTTVAAITSTGLTIYNNIDKIRKIVKPRS